MLFSYIRQMMVSQIPGSFINNISQSYFQPQSYAPQAYAIGASSMVDSSGTSSGTSSLNSFDDEDQAIISSEAKLLSELDKFNSGTSDPLNLAMASVMAKVTVSAEVNVIQTKKEMFDAILDIGKD